MRGKLIVLAILLAGFGVLALAARAEEPLDPADPAVQQCPKLTDEQREAVKKLIQDFRTDIKPLREALRTEVQKLRELRRDKAGTEAVKAQFEVVKTKVQAIRARVQKLRGDLKAILPPEVFQKWQQRFHARVQRFLDNHPGLKALRERLRQGGAGADAAQ